MIQIHYIFLILVTFLFHFADENMWLRAISKLSKITNNLCLINRAGIESFLYDFKIWKVGGEVFLAIHFHFVYYNYPQIHTIDTLSHVVVVVVVINLKQGNSNLT